MESWVGPGNEANWNSLNRMLCCSFPLTSFPSSPLRVLNILIYVSNCQPFRHQRMPTVYCLQLLHVGLGYNLMHASALSLHVCVHIWLLNVLSVVSDQWSLYGNQMYSCALWERLLHSQQEPLSLYNNFQITLDYKCMIHVHVCTMYVCILETLDTPGHVLTLWISKGYMISPGSIQNSHTNPLPWQIW